MLKTRIIPTLLWRGPNLVKGVGFDSWRPVGTVLPAIKVFNRRDVDELVLLDIAATSECREPDYEELARLTAECFIPLCFGGGLSDENRILKALRAGADKVVLNSAALDDPALIERAAKRFGSQCVVVAIDTRKTTNGVFECFGQGATRGTGHSPVAWAVECERLGAGEILLTAVERDGSMTGYDCELLQSVCAAVTIPVIASGGAGAYEHMLEAVNAGASAVAAAAMFQFTERTPAEAKDFLARNGIPVRR